MSISNDIDKDIITQLTNIDVDINAGLFTSDGKIMVLGAVDKSIKLVDTTNWNIINELKGHKQRIVSLQLSPDGKYLVSLSTPYSSGTGEVKVWDTSTWQEISTFENYKAGFIDAVFSPDGQLMFILEKESIVSVWDVKDWKNLRSLTHNIDLNDVMSISIDPEGKYLATGACGDIYIWELDSLSIVKTLRKNDYFCVSTLDFSMDGKYLAAGTWDKKTYVYNTNTWGRIKILPGNSNEVTSSSFSSNDQLFVAAYSTTTISLWQTKHWKLVKKWAPHNALITTLFFSPDSKYLVTASTHSDNKVSIWNMGNYITAELGNDKFPQNTNSEQNNESSNILRIMIFLSAIIIILIIVFAIYSYLFTDDDDDVMYDSDEETELKEIIVRRGFDRAGQYLKIGVKVENKGGNVITAVQVNLNVPSGLEYIGKMGSIVSLGTIQTATSRSANFKMKPIGRCVEGFFSGVVLYRDFQGNQQSVDIKPMNISSICPMLEQSEVSRDDFMKLMHSKEMKVNKAHILFEGSTVQAFQVAKNRVRSLTIIDEDSEEQEGLIVSYACYYGKTKYKNFRFVVEILASGTETEGALTIVGYSDEASLLTGFFADLLEDIKKIIKITEESAVSEPLKCSGCGAPIDLSQIEEHGFHTCKHCNTLTYIALWNRVK